MTKESKVHELAIRLVEGGIVEIDGHWVAMLRNPYLFDPCNECELDSICHESNTISDVCMECDIITRVHCFLVLKDSK